MARTRRRPYREQAAALASTPPPRHRPRAGLCGPAGIDPPAREPSCAWSDCRDLRRGPTRGVLDAIVRRARTRARHRRRVPDAATTPAGGDSQAARPARSPPVPGVAAAPGAGGGLVAQTLRPMYRRLTADAGSGTPPTSTPRSVSRALSRSAAPRCWSTAISLRAVRVHPEPAPFGGRGALLGSLPRCRVVAGADPACHRDHGRADRALLAHAGSSGRRGARPVVAVVLFGGGVDDIAATLGELLGAGCGSGRLRAASGVVRAAPRVTPDPWSLGGGSRSA